MVAVFKASIGRIPPVAHAEAVGAQHLHVDAALVERTDPIRAQRLLGGGNLRGKRGASDDVDDRLVVVVVAEEHVEATLQYLTGPVAAMIQLQLLTAMRPGEVCAMRGCDLNTAGKLWVIRWWNA